MKQILHQVVFPANFQAPAPPAAHPTLMAMDAPVKVTVAAGVLAATFSLFSPVPAKAAPVVATYDSQPRFKTFQPPQDGQTLYNPVVSTASVYRPGSESYTNQINFKTVVGPQDGQELARFASINPPANTSGFVTYHTQIQSRTGVAEIGQLLFKPPSQATGFQSYDNLLVTRTIVGPEVGQVDFKPVTAVAAVFQPGSDSYNNQINFRTIVGPQDVTVSFQPPTVAGAVFKAGSDSFNNQVNFQTIVRLDTGQVPFRPPATPTGWQSYENRVIGKTFVPAQDAFQHRPFNVFVLPTGFQTYENQVNFRTIVGPQDIRADIKPPPLPTGWQTYDTPTRVVSFVRPEAGLALFQPVVIPGAAFQAGSDTYNNQINFQTIIRLETGQSIFQPPAPVQLPTGFGSWENYFFAKPNPLAIHAELSPFIPALPSVPPESGIPSGDGPPWHLTNKEIKRLLHYREELRALQNAYDLRHRENVNELLRDVNIAAGRIEIEPETIPAIIPHIEARIQRLPALSKKSLFSFDLKALKQSVDQNILEREEEDEEVAITMLLREFFS